MAERETSQAIDDAAAAWVAREDRAPLSTEDAQALQDWLSQDLRRPGALLRARAVALRSQSAAALGRQYDPANFRGLSPRTAPPSRRSVLAWGGGLAAGLVIATAVGVSLHAPEAHATALGEIRLVPLHDGSAVMLNTTTRVTVKYAETSRRVRLVDGEADFRVLADARRPFVVDVGDQRVVATGDGAFRIRKLKDGLIDILVHAGIVQAMSGDADPVVLGPNTRFEIQSEAGSRSPKTQPRPVSPSAVTRELAWREGKIAFEGESLAEAANAFTRYSQTRIVIEDPALAQEPITGLFAANDPAGFGHAAASVFGTNVAERDGIVILGGDHR